MTIQQLYYAITIADCGSMNKASEKLFISQPTLTGSVKDLEEEIGISIFLRTHKGVIPTVNKTMLRKGISGVIAESDPVGTHLRGKNFRVSDAVALRPRFLPFADNFYIERFGIQ